MSGTKPKLHLPVYDDFGNHVGMPLDARTFERNVGCWNCVSANADLIYRERARAAYIRDAAVYQHRDGLTMHQAKIKANRVRQLLTAKAGIIVVCTNAKSGVADFGFVACKHVCDEWTGLPGVLGSLAPGEKLAEPVQALYEGLGEPATDGVKPGEGS